MSKSIAGQHCKSKITPLLKTAGAGSLQESPAGYIQNIKEHRYSKYKGKINQDSKKYIPFVIPIPELFSVEDSSMHLFKVEKFVEQIMEQINNNNK